MSKNIIIVTFSITFTSLFRYVFGAHIFKITRQKEKMTRYNDHYKFVYWKYVGKLRISPHYKFTLSGAYSRPAEIDEVMPINWNKWKGKVFIEKEIKNQGDDEIRNADVSVGNDSTHLYPLSFRKLLFSHFQSINIPFLCRWKE